MTDSDTPRTAAGRALLNRRSYWRGNIEIRQSILAIEAEAAQPVPPPSALAEAAMYALGYMNDPEGLAHMREEWRDNLRAALVAGQAEAAQHVPPEKAWHGDGDECIGIHCGNPEHGWAEHTP